MDRQRFIGISARRALRCFRVYHLLNAWDYHRNQKEEQEHELRSRKKQIGEVKLSVSLDAVLTSCYLQFSPRMLRWCLCAYHRLTELVRLTD